MVEWRADPRLLLGPRAARVAADIGAIVFVEPAGFVETALEPVHPDQALVRLLGHLYEPTIPPLAHETLAELSRRVPAFALQLESPLEAAQLLDKQLLA
jgi:hypothetical protein